MFSTTPSALLLLLFVLSITVLSVVQAWTSQLNDPPMVTEDGIDTSGWPQNNLIVAISSDRGLCGGEKITIAYRAVAAWFR